MKKLRHYIAPKVLESSHRIGVVLVGAGGTGSQVLMGLGKISHALGELGLPQLYVTAVDDDLVSTSNIGRQAFAKSDVGESKAATLITRLNQHYGTDWRALPVRLPNDGALPFIPHTNFLITCVDTAKARIEIAQWFAKIGNEERHPHHNCAPEYWLDFGNARNSGQTILGTMRPVEQPKKSEHDLASELPTVLDLYPDLANVDEGDDTPSCSLPEALRKQGLFVNTTVASMGCDLLFDFIRFGYAEEAHGFFFGKYSSSPLMVSRETWATFGYKQEDAGLKAA